MSTQIMKITFFIEKVSKYAPTVYLNIIFA